MKLKQRNYLSYMYVVVLLTISFQQVNGQGLGINHGPYIQNLTTREVTIVWTTTADCISWVEYYEEDGSNFYEKEIREGPKTIQANRNE